ncbi:MAG: hypothetical protein ACOYNY_14925 [Caldilineaceae bacterium]
MSNHAIQLRQRVETIMPDLVITHLELNQEGLINDYAQSIELQWVLLGLETGKSFWFTAHIGGARDVYA